MILVMVLVGKVVLGAREANMGYDPIGMGDMGEAKLMTHEEVRKEVLARVKLAVELLRSARETAKSNGKKLREMDRFDELADIMYDFIEMPETHYGDDH